MSDVFTTAYHAVTGADISEGDTILVIGDGAVGLLACHAARLFSPAAIVLAGHHHDRLEVGRGPGPSRRSPSRAVVKLHAPGTTDVEAAEAVPGRVAGPAAAARGLTGA